MCSVFFPTQKSSIFYLISLCPLKFNRLSWSAQRLFFCFWSEPFDGHACLFNVFTLIITIVYVHFFSGYGKVGILECWSFCRWLFFFCWWFKMQKRRKITANAAGESTCLSWTSFRVHQPKWHCANCHNQNHLQSHVYQHALWFKYSAASLLKARETQHRQEENPKKRLRNSQEVE